MARGRDPAGRRQAATGIALLVLAGLVLACGDSGGTGTPDGTGIRDAQTSGDPGPHDRGEADLPGPDLQMDQGNDRPPGTDLPPKEARDPGWDAGGDPGGTDLEDPGGEVPLPRPVPGEIAGMCPLDADPSEAHWDRIAAWGVRVVRQGFFWEWISRPDGSLDFSWPDRYLDAAGRRGIRVLIVLDYDHPSLHQPGDPRPSIPPEALPRWIGYVRAVAERYGSRAFGFEVWNEPNLPTFWKGSPEDFGTLAAATIPVIREAAPGVPVAVAGLSLLPLDWLEMLERTGVLAAADALSFHPYWVDAEGALDMVSLARDWLSSRGRTLPIWITEYGWPTGGTYMTATTLEGQAERLVRFLPGAAVLGVEAAWWYASLDWRDPEAVEDPDASEGFFGIAWPTAGDKPAAGAFRVLAEALPGATPDPDLPGRLGIAPPLVGTGFRRPPGTFLLVATNPSDRPASLDLPPGSRVTWPPEAPPSGPWMVPGGRSLVAEGPDPAAGQPVWFPAAGRWTSTRSRPFRLAR